MSKVKAGEMKTDEPVDSELVCSPLNNCCCLLSCSYCVHVIHRNSKLAFIP